MSPVSARTRALAPATAALALALHAGPARVASGGPCAVTFTSPDTISAGEMLYENCDVTVSGATLVVIGPHTFASLVVTPGGRVTSAMLDSLTLSVTGALRIEAGGRVSVDGLGYALGAGPGSGNSGTPASGGSHGGRGGPANVASGPTYGSLTAPALPGSGGGVSGVSTGRGGGALRLAVGGELRVDGELTARGDSAATLTPSYSPGGGAGGSIHLSAGAFAGTGTIDAGGGRGYNQGGGGGGGRIAVEYGAREFAGAILACGGLSSVPGRAGAAGTVWTRAAGEALGELRVGNCGIATAARSDLPESTMVLAGALRVADGAVLGVALGRPLDLTVQGDATIETGAAISVDGGGFTLGSGPGAGGSGTPAAGGSHGGRGGDASDPSGPTYGSFENPAGFGSGGGVSGVSRGSGGGALRLAVAGELRLDGRLGARGDSATTVTPAYSPGGGSGGSIRVSAGTLSGAGVIDAGGGRGYAQGASGGGGRIAIEYGASSFAGLVTACGAPASVPERAGAAGTIWLRDTDDAPGELRVANCGRWTLARTELPDTVTTVAGTLDVREAGHVGVAAGRSLQVTVQGDLRVEAGAALSVDGRGHAIGTGPGAGEDGSPAAGGSHGGRGGYTGGTVSGPTYGSSVFPDEFGSGGGVSGVSKANGGGVLQLDVAGEIRVDGRVSARGDSATTITPGYSPGGGAGGSIRVTAAVISGSGDIDASGGPGLNGGGGGGGGRIAIESFCWDGFSPLQLRVAGGAGGAVAAEAGSIHPAFEVGIAAGPIATSGTLRVLGYPKSLAESASESADSLALFKERGGLQLAAGDTLWLEITEPGVVASETSFTRARLLPGTWLNSHTVHLDPPGAGTARARGSVTFDTNVLGLIVTGSGLDSSHALLRAPAVDYSLALATRGIEFAGTDEADTVEISADRRTVTVSLAAASALDQLRIVTAVPLATCGPVADVPPGAPASVAAVLLAPPFPNPSRGEVALRFALSAPASVRLTIYDIAGRLVTTLADGPRAAGWHAATWRPDAGGGAPAGVYFARLEAGTTGRTVRIVRHP